MTTGLDGIRETITSAPLRELIEVFGGRLPDAATGDLLAWLDDFSGEHWDFRRGRVERHLMGPADLGAIPPAVISRAATALGLTGTRAPARADYSHLLILGGLGATCLQRAEHAAGLWRSGRVGSPRVTGLGSFRPLHEAELTVPALTGCRYEVDAMRVGVRDSFGLADPVEHRGPTGPVTHQSWSITTFEPPSVQVMAAPSAEPATRRADTSDTYRFWARHNSPGPDDTILIVTSPIYVPFQHADALRLLTLPYGCTVDTVGLDTGQAIAPERYLQEIRSTVRSLRRLHAVIG
ncbi:hypothetical protein AB0J83_37325 [Actinoplanes sp. NPDC049596]|uniref:hypothetical protein n=1 Tax=unclassified Actinoplanes TaxID=2626549 RepID=UPI00343F89A6